MIYPASTIANDYLKHFHLNRFSAGLDYHLGEPLHLLKLRTRLKEQQINSYRFKLADSLGDCLGCADES